MDNNLEFRLKLNTDSEYKNLYEWSIDEVDSEGNVVGKTNQVHCDINSFSFVATEITYTPEFEMADTNKSVKNDKNDYLETAKFVTEDRNTIQGKLKSSETFPQFSFFGTNRKLDTFDLIIQSDKDLKEVCYLNGFPESRHDFDSSGAMIINDCVQIVISTSKERFEKIVDLILKDRLNGLTINLSGVQGFYSNWTPDGSYMYVKILTGSNKVDIPENCEIKPPKIGIVENVTVRPVTIQNLVLTEEKEDYNEENTTLQKSGSSKSDALPKQEGYRKFFDKLLWIIIIIGLAITILNQ